MLMLMLPTGWWRLRSLPVSAVVPGVQLSGAGVSRKLDRLVSTAASPSAATPSGVRASRCSFSLLRSLLYTCSAAGFSLVDSDVLSAGSWVLVPVCWFPVPGLLVLTVVYAQLMGFVARTGAHCGGL